jgi:hypothetical protein
MERPLSLSTKLRKKDTLAVSPKMASLVEQRKRVLTGGWKRDCSKSSSERIKCMISDMHRNLYVRCQLFLEAGR